MEESKYMLIRKGGKAIHMLGDISRDFFDAELIIVHDEDEENYIGHYAEGFGFINVKFRKSDCRLAADEEVELCFKGKMEDVKFDNY